MFICCKRIKALKHFLVFSFRMTSAVFHMTHSDVLSHFFCLFLPTTLCSIPVPVESRGRAHSHQADIHRLRCLSVCTGGDLDAVHCPGVSGWILLFHLFMMLKYLLVKPRAPVLPNPPPFFFLKDTELRRLETGTVTYLLIRPVWVLTSANAVITVVYTWVHSEGLWQCSGAVN